MKYAICNFNEVYVPYTLLPICVYVHISNGKMEKTIITVPPRGHIFEIFIFGERIES